MEYERILSGYKYAELRIEKSTESLIQIKDDETSYSSGSTQGISVRVLEDGSWGFASGSRENIDKLLDRAQKLAKLAKGKTRIKIPKPEKKELRHKTGTELDVKELLEASKAMKGKKISSRIISCTGFSTQNEFYNSEGAEIIQESGYTYLSCTCIAKSAGIMQRGSERSWSRTGFAGLNAVITGQKSMEKAKRLVDAAPPPKGRYIVVLDPEMTGVFSHEAIGHACEGDVVADGESLLANRKGEKIGNELVTIIDDPGANDFGYYEYDDEGVKARPTVLVEKGIVNEFLNSMATCQEGELNGHARAEDFSEVPIVRMSNTYFQKGDHSIDEIFDITGIYLKGMRGGSVDTFSGGFMFKAVEAYEIKNGEKGKIMRDVTITGNILQTLKDVECVGKDFGSSPGICGKLGQEIPVSDGGPHIRIRGIAIG